jgi:hypothetical protein
MTDGLAMDQRLSVSIFTDDKTTKNVKSVILRQKRQKASFSA